MVFISSQGRSWVYRVPLCFMSAVGERVLSVGLVLPYRERVRESSDRPHSSKSNTPHVHMPSLTHYWQHKGFMLPAICLLYFAHQICDIIIWLCLSLITRETDKTHWAISMQIGIFLLFWSLLRFVCLFVCLFGSSAYEPLHGLILMISL